METFGSRDRCVYCHSREMTAPRVVVEDDTSSGKQYQMFACSAKCESALTEFLRFAEARKTTFVLAIVGCMLVGAIGVTLGAALNQKLMLIATLSTCGFGAALWFMPFVTPQTIELVGIKRGILIGKIAAVLLIALGLGTSVPLLL